MGERREDDLGFLKKINFKTLRVYLTFFFGYLPQLFTTG
jgi:hypothetical protein